MIGHKRRREEEKKRRLPWVPVEQRSMKSGSVPLGKKEAKVGFYAFVRAPGSPGVRAVSRAVIRLRSKYIVPCKIFTPCGVVWSVSSSIP